MSLIRRIAGAWHAHRVAADVVFALLLCAVVTAEALNPNVTTPRGLAVAVALAMTLPLAFRRRQPLAVGVVVFGAFAVLGLADHSRLPPDIVLLPAGVAAWSLGAYADRRRDARIGVAVILAGLALNEAGDMIVLAPLMVGLWAVGRLLRDREQWGRELQERAVALEQERAETARQAIAEERARIARELHDVVAHHVSVMVVQAGAERLAVAREHPETAEALSAIEDTGRQALAEMRLLLGMLRRDDDEIALAPQPSLQHLDSLVEHVRSAGLPVELVIEGTEGVVPPGVDISAYRVVQEALTNALKHAGPARARVRVRYEKDHVEIEVADDGHGPGGDSGGQGLVGMKERVSVYGGDLEAGPGPEGGFLVRTRLPLGQAAR